MSPTSPALKLHAPLECVGADGAVYPARLLATDWKSSSQGLYPIAVGVDVGAREEFAMFAPDGTCEKHGVLLRNADTSALKAGKTK